MPSRKLLNTHKCDHDGKPVLCPRGLRYAALRRLLTGLIRDAAKARTLQAAPGATADLMPDATVRLAQILPLLEAADITRFRNPLHPHAIHPDVMQSILAFCVENYRSVFEPWLTPYQTRLTVPDAANALATMVTQGNAASQYEEIFPHPGIALARAAAMAAAIEAGGKRPVGRPAGRRGSNANANANRPVPRHRRPSRHVLAARLMAQDSPSAATGRCWSAYEIATGKGNNWLCMDPRPNARLYVWTVRMTLVPLIGPPLDRTARVMVVGLKSSDAAPGDNNGGAAAWLMAYTLRDELAAEFEEVIIDAVRDPMPLLPTDRVEGVRHHPHILAKLMQPEVDDTPENHTRRIAL